MSKYNCLDLFLVDIVKRSVLSSKIDSTHKDYKFIITISRDNTISFINANYTKKHVYVINSEYENETIDYRKYVNNYYLAFSYINLDELLMQIIDIGNKIVDNNINIAFYIDNITYHDLCQKYNLIYSDNVYYHNLFIKKNRYNTLVIYDLNKILKKTKSFYDKLDALIDYTVFKTYLLTDSEIMEIGDNFPLCNYSFFKMIIEYIKIKYSKKSIDVNFYDKINNTVNNFSALYYYFNYIYFYYDKEYVIYSLGSSLEKMNNLWNIKNEKKIIIIPFSGNALDHPNDFDQDKYPYPYKIDPDFASEHDITKSFKDGTTFTIDKELSFFNINAKFETMNSKFGKLIKNNINFNKLVKDILANKNILLTDVISRGKSLYTILLLLQNNGIPFNNLHFLYIAEHESSKEDIKNYINNIRYNFEIFNIEFDYKKIFFIPDLILAPEHFQNSERSFSRCTSTYKYSKWDHSPDKIFTEERSDRHLYNEPNYLRCNIHKLLYYISGSCFYDNFIKPSFDKNIEDYSTLVTKINSFINVTEKENLMEGFDKKYFKYKIKYLKLKQKYLK